MADPAIQRAKQRLRELKKVIDTAQSETKKIEAFLEMYDHFSGTEEESSETQPKLPIGQLNPGRVAETPPRERGRPADFARYMEGILRDVERPLFRSQLVEELEKRGHVIPGEDKPRYVGTILWRFPSKFVNIAKKGYWLRNEPSPASNYWPEDSKAHSDIPEHLSPAFGEDERD